MKNEKLNKTISERLEEGRSYRKARPFEVRQQDDGRKEVTGYATTFNEPYELFHYDNWEGYRVRILEQVDPEAFEQCDMTDTIMQYNHEGRVFARVSNGTLKIRTDQHGLFVEADLSGTEIGRQLYEEIRDGYTNRMSFGFTITKDKREEERDEDNKTITVTRTITKIGKLYDVSAVSIPANDGTEISARSWCDGVIAELAEEFREAEEIKDRKTRLRILTEVMQNELQRNDN